MTKQIKPSQWYTMQDIVRDKMFPWAKTYPTVRKFVVHDFVNNNILKTTVAGFGRGTKYRFKGENIIKFINAVEAGKVRL